MSGQGPAEQAFLATFKQSSSSFLSNFMNIKRVSPVIIIIALWELLPAMGLIDPLFLPAFHDVLATGWDLIVSLEIFMTISVSLRRGFIGYILAVSTATPLGVLIGWKRSFYYYAEVLIEVLRPLPSVALIPVFLLFLGPTEKSILAVIFYPVFFIQLIATIYGTQNISQTQIDSMKILGMSDRRLFREVFFPGTLPGIFSGLRQNTAIMLILTIVAELLLASDGIGNFIMVTQRNFQISEMYFGIMIIGVLGYLLNKAFLVVQNRILFWTERQTIR